MWYIAATCLEPILKDESLGIRNHSTTNFDYPIPKLLKNIFLRKNVFYSKKIFSNYSANQSSIRYIKKLNKTFKSFITPKKLIKLFYTLNKTPLGQTGYLSNLYYLLAAENPVFLIQSLSRTQSVKTPLVPYHSLCSTCVTYGTPCQIIVHQILPTKLIPRKQRISLRVASIVRMYLCTHYHFTCNTFNQ